MLLVMSEELAYLKLPMFADRPPRTDGSWARSDGWRTPSVLDISGAYGRLARYASLFLPILSPLPRLPFVDEYHALNIEHSYSNIDPRADRALQQYTLKDYVCSL